MPLPSSPDVFFIKYRHRGQPNGLSSLWAEGQPMLYTRYRKLVYASNSFNEKVGCIKDLKVIVVYKKKE